MNMDKRNYIFLNATRVLMTSLAATPVLSENATPFHVRNFEKVNDATPRPYEGMCGACRSNMEGRCGGMMGGAMPPSFDPEQLPKPDSSEAKLVAKYCTQCHGLPSPEQHTVTGWPQTVARMNTRMQWMSRNDSPMNIAAPNEKELASITAYLIQHAGTVDK